MAFNKKNFRKEKKITRNDEQCCTKDFKKDPNKVIELLNFMARSPIFF